MQVVGTPGWSLTSPVAEPLPLLCLLGVPCGPLCFLKSSAGPPTVCPAPTSRPRHAPTPLFCWASSSSCCSLTPREDHGIIPIHAQPGGRASFQPPFEKISRGATHSSRCHSRSAQRSSPRSQARARQANRSGQEDKSDTISHRGKQVTAQVRVRPGWPEAWWIPLQAGGVWRRAGISP